MRSTSTEDARASELAVALGQRLRAAADAALETSPPPAPDPVSDADSCLQALVRELAGTVDARLAWLTLTALAGAFPVPEDVRHLLRAADLEDAEELTVTVLDRAHGLAARHHSLDRQLRIETGVVVDVDMCARSAFHNGIQRTTREVVSRWGADHAIHLVAWTATSGATRTLTPTEHDLAARWDESLRSVVVEPSYEADRMTELVVPWRTTLVLPEVPLPDRCPPLAALAEFSGNRVVAIGYDAIPVVSADLRPLGEPNGFAAYLALIKHTDRVAGISGSASEEFAGYASALASQGLAGPDVVEVLLPTEVPPAPSGWHRAEPPRPLVVAVGRLEPHKNHDALLFAAERLWREGLQFDLHLVGGPGWDLHHVQETLERLDRDGRPLQWSRSMGDDELWELLRSASFSVFISLHEGFGLPVAESLACGTPVLTTAYGSQGEIAAAGGCLTVDPRDDESVVEGLRRMVTEPGLVDELRTQAANRPRRTWDDYAADLWRALVEEEVR